MSDSQRNFLILIAIAIVGVLFSGVFSVAAAGVGTLLHLAFMAAIVIGLAMAYRRNEGTIATLPMQWRVLLQASGVMLLLVLVTGMFFPAWGMASAGGAALFFLLLGASIVGIYLAWQQRSYRL